MGYAYYQSERHGNVRAILMHRVIANTPEGLDTDHIDRNKLNNQCSNLEAVTHRENVRRALSRRNGVCSKNHPLLPDNIYVRNGEGKRGDTECRTCRRETNRLYRQRKRQRLKQGTTE